VPPPSSYNTAEAVVLLARIRTNELVTAVGAAGVTTGIGVGVDVGVSRGVTVGVSDGLGVTRTDFGRSNKSSAVL
jgi:hypothetical protein